MALTSPWNVAFWLAASRPELASARAGSLLIMAAAVIAGAPALHSIQGDAPSKKETAGPLSTQRIRYPCA
jgi:hypothetical protein